MNRAVFLSVISASVTPALANNFFQFSGILRASNPLSALHPICASWRNPDGPDKVISGSAFLLLKPRKSVVSAISEPSKKALFFFFN